MTAPAEGSDAASSEAPADDLAEDAAEEPAPPPGADADGADQAEGDAKGEGIAMATMTLRVPDEALRRQLDASREHFSSEGARGASVSLSFEHLEGLDLSKVVLVDGHLHETVLTGSRLVDAQLMSADAPGANFDGVDADGINLAKAELEGASFRHARMRGAVLRRARLANAVLEGADLRDADLFDAVCLGANLRGATLAGADLTAAILAGSDLRGADLRGARLDRTGLDDVVGLEEVLGLDGVTVVSITTARGILEGWKAGAWLARRAITVPPEVAFQAYLLGQMSNDEHVARGCNALGLKREQVNTLRRLLGKVFDVPGHAAAEYERWLGAPGETGPVAADGTFAGSTRSWWRLPLWPDVRFGVSTHPDGYAWDMRFEGGHADPSMVGSTTLDRLRAGGVRTEELEAWPPMREVLATCPDGRAYELRFDFDLLQRSKPLG